MTTHNTRKMLGNITQKEFAERFNIPVSTVKNWDARDCMPEYVFYMACEIYNANKDYNLLWGRMILKGLESGE